MFVHSVSKRSVANIAYTIGLLLAGGVLLCRPQAVITGVNRGLSVCTSVILPTLYPFMLLSGLLADSPLCRHPRPSMESITRCLFGLPGCCGPAILLSLVGGYPAGALAIGRLRQQGLLTTQQAQRMLTFCVCGGPGFIISTVGAGLLGSVRGGVLLFVAQAMTALIIGLWQGRGHRKKATNAPIITTPPRALATIISDTCGSLLTMCGFVVLAAVILSIFEAFEVPTALERFTGLAARHWSGALAAITEVSSGCIALSGEELAPFFLSLTLSWAGLSVQGQIAAALPGVPVLGAPFWSWRLCHGAAAGLLATLLFHLIPTDTATLQNHISVLPHTASFSSSIMLLTLSFLAMLCFSPKNTGNLQ